MLFFRGATVTGNDSLEILNPCGISEIGGNLGFPPSVFAR